MTTIGFVGLGIIGSTLSRHLREDGHVTVGYDIRPEAVAEFAADGGHEAAGPREVADRADILITAVATVGVLPQLAAEIAGTSTEDLIAIDVGTLPIEEKEQARDLYAAAGIPMLDCTISGTGAQVAVRDLTFMASGDPGVIAAVQPVLEPLGRALYDVGPFGNGMKMKLIANHLVGIHSLAAAEALLLAERGGLDPRQVLEVIGASAGTSRMFEVRGPLVVDRTYDVATARLDMWVKDLTLISEFAAAVHAAAPLLRVTKQVFEEAMAQGLGEQDAAAVHAFLETMEPGAGTAP
jgi:3-hydroxyisobutyrate dehydrogenase-like beta-hydroxyacid dehydrogenase